MKRERIHGQDESYLFQFEQVIGKYEKPQPRIYDDKGEHTFQLMQIINNIF